MSTNGSSSNGSQINVEVADSKRLEELMETPSQQTKRQSRQTKKTATSSRQTKSAAKTKTATKTKTADDRQQQSAGVGDGLGKVTDNLKSSIKRKIVTTAIRGAIDDIKRGDFGDLDDLTLEEIDNAIDCEFSCLEEMVDPKFALPPSSGSKLLLNGTSGKS